MKQSLIYTIKIWLTVVLIVPILLLILQNNIGWTIFHYLTEYYWVVIGELLVYSPLIVIFFFTTFWINRKIWIIKNKKLIILFQTELVFLLATILFGYFIVHLRSFNIYRLEYITINIIIIGLGILFYKLNPVNKISSIDSYN